MAVEAEWFRAFVERSLQTVWALDEIVQDDDGDYAFGADETMAWVSVVHGGESALAEPHAG